MKQRIHAVLLPFIRIHFGPAWIEIILFDRKTTLSLFN